MLLDCKQELCMLIDEIKEYYISFDSGIEKKIRNWNFESEEELTEWEKRFATYLLQIELEKFN